MTSHRKSTLFYFALAAMSALSCGRVWAVFQDIPIAVVPGSTQRMPTLSENWIAWEDDRAHLLLRAVRAESRSTGTESWVSPDPTAGPVADYAHPRLSGDSITFQGNPESKGTMFIDNLADANPFQKVYDESIHQYAGELSGNLVVWEGTASNPLAGDIYGSFVGTNTKFPISTTGKAHSGPITDGRFLVWQEEVAPSQIRLFQTDLQTGNSAFIPDSAFLGDIDNGVFVCPASGGIRVINLLTNQDSLILMPTPSSVAISGDVVVYSIKTAGKTDSDIWGLRLSTGDQFLISDAPGNQTEPDIYGNFVVWSDRRNGDNDIYGAMIPEPCTPALLAVASMACGLFVRRRP